MLAFNTVQNVIFALAGNLCPTPHTRPEISRAIYLGIFNFVSIGVQSETNVQTEWGALIGILTIFKASKLKSFQYSFLGGAVVIGGTRRPIYILNSLEVTAT